MYECTCHMYAYINVNAHRITDILLLPFHGTSSIINVNPGLINPKRLFNWDHLDIRSPLLGKYHPYEISIIHRFSMKPGLT